MNPTLVLFDDERRDDLLPFTFLRSVADIRIGILTIREKWEKVLSTSSCSITADYLQAKYPFVPSSNGYLYINSGILPDKNLVKDIQALISGEELRYNDSLIACRTETRFNSYKEINGQNSSKKYTSSVLQIQRPWDIFLNNGHALGSDYELITSNRKSNTLSKTNTVLGTSIFVEEGAQVECAILNTNTGPIYIGKNAEIMEGAIIRGPFALCEGATVKLGCKVYGPTTVGPYSKIGGEVSNSVIFGYSNKGHDGFLGNSVIAEWCNLGADTNNSNLKNNYSQVKVWGYKEQDFIDTGLQFCGLLMGDHSKSGINTMFNTGTVVGIFANIFGAGFPEKYIPSFSWGGAEGFKPYELSKALETASRMYERRKLRIPEAEEEIIKHLYSGEKAFKYA